MNVLVSDGGNQLRVEQGNIAAVLGTRLFATLAGHDDLFYRLLCNGTGRR